MSLDIEFQCGAAALSVRVTQDLLVVEALRATLPEAVALLLDAGDAGVEEPVDGRAVEAAARALLAAIGSGVVALPSVFKLIDPDGGVIHSGMTDNINGQSYSFRCGADLCQMRPMVLDVENGRLREGEPVTDLRGAREVATDYGVFRIKRSAKPLGLRKELVRIAEFAGEHEGEGMSKVIH